MKTSVICIMFPVICGNVVKNIWQMLQYCGANMIKQCESFTPLEFQVAHIYFKSISYLILTYLTRHCKCCLGDGLIHRLGWSHELEVEMTYIFHLPHLQWHQEVCLSPSQGRIHSAANYTQQDDRLQWTTALCKLSSVTWLLLSTLSANLLHKQ